MHEIYANASICIASSATPNAGIFASADQERRFFHPLISFSTSSFSKNGTVSLRRQMNSFPSINIMNEHLHRRAWALQERILAQRFRASPNPLALPINELVGKKSNFYLARGHNGRWATSFSICADKLQSHPNIRGYTQNGYREHIMDWWYPTLWCYIRRSITVHGDPLPEIGGV
jgi:hypothetical protein